ncbi:MAG: NUDIX hydrolase [Candidatus Nanohaloarchaea archaeon]
MKERSALLLTRDGEVLLVETESGWSLPSTGSQDREPTAAAMEVAEDLGVDAELTQPFYSGEHQEDGEIVLVHCYLADFTGEPSGEWVETSELDGMDLGPGLEQIKPALRRI